MTGKSDQQDGLEQCRVQIDGIDADILQLLNRRAELAQQQEKIIATRQRLTVAMRDLGFDVVDSHANFVWCTHSAQPVQPIRS